jgi:ribonuclease Z
LDPLPAKDRDGKDFLFLGTSSGTPTKTRNMSALALRSIGSRHWSLIDCAEGTQHTIMYTSLPLMDLGAIFITHVHGHHCYGHRPRTKVMLN